MEQYINKSEVVICHGGPATFMNSLSKGKKQLLFLDKKYGEHVNDHQVEFVRRILQDNNILFIENIDDLFEKIIEVSKQTNFTSNNNFFVKD